jgi:hypothetical protein
MPSISINLAQPQVDDLQVVVQLGPARLNALADALERIKPTIRRSKLRRIIVTAIGEEAAAPMRVLLGMAYAIRTQKMRPADLLKALDGFLASRDWDQSELMRWHECSPIVERLVTAQSVILTAKARDLAEDFERALTTARILTDVRPVYSDSDDIVGAEVIQTLRIEFDSDSNVGATLSFGLDLEDIKDLRLACDRALKKAEEAARLMRSQLGDEVLMIGDA